MKFSSLAALEVVILTTSSAANDENFIQITTFPFQCDCRFCPYPSRSLQWHWVSAGQETLKNVRIRNMRMHNKLLTWSQQSKELQKSTKYIQFCCKTVYILWYILYVTIGHVNSSILSDIYTSKCRPSLVRIMACCLFGTKPLSEPMLAYY